MCGATHAHTQLASHQILLVAAAAATEIRIRLTAFWSHGDGDGHGVKVKERREISKCFIAYPSNFFWPECIAYFPLCVALKRVLVLVEFPDTRPIYTSSCPLRSEPQFACTARRERERLPGCENVWKFILTSNKSMADPPLCIRMETFQTECV